MLKTATSLEFETKPSYTIRVRTTDDGGASFEQTFTVELTDVIKLSPAEVAENQPAGTTVGRLTGTPPGSDIGFGHFYWLLGGAGDSDNGSFVLDGSNGQLRTAASFD